MISNMFSLLNIYSGISSYNVTYNSSDGMSNETTTNSTSVTLTDLEPNTTYTVVVEALAPDNTVDQTSEQETFTTSTTLHNFLLCNF